MDKGRLLCIKPFKNYLFTGNFYEFEFYNKLSPYTGAYNGSPFKIFLEKNKFKYNALTFSESFVGEHFVDLAKWREIQIDEILND